MAANILPVTYFGRGESYQMFSTKEAFSLASPQVGAEGGGRAGRSGRWKKAREGGREGKERACDGDGERKSRAEKTSERARGVKQQAAFSESVSWLATIRVSSSCLPSLFFSQL